MSHIETKNKYFILTGISIASFIGCIDFTIVNTALPAIQAGLNASIGELQWVINIFILALSAFMVVAGKVADIYGRRLVLYLGMGIFAIASLFAGLSTTIYQLIFWRFLQGVSCTILYTATGAIISEAFPISEKGKAMGILFGVNALGLAIGPVIGGMIIGALSWHYVFFINIPLILLSLIICLPHVSESRNKVNKNNIDFIGAVILVIGLCLLFFTLNQANNWGWYSPKTLFMSFTAIALLVLFHIVEKRTSEPIIKFSLFTNRDFVISIIATFSLAFFYCIAFFLIPLYLHDIKGYSDYAVGLMLLPITATIAVSSPLVGRYIDKNGAIKPLLWGFICFLISAFLQAQFSLDSPLWYIILAFICMGIGWACILSPSTVLALSATPASDSALAMGASWTLHNIGGVVGLAGGLAVYYFKYQTTHSFLVGYQSAMTLLIAFSSVSFLIIFYLKSYNQTMSKLN